MEGENCDPQECCLRPFLDRTFGSEILVIGSPKREAAMTAILPQHRLPSSEFASAPSQEWVAPPSSPVLPSWSVEGSGTFSYSERNRDCSST